MKKKAVFLDRDGVLNRAIVREGKPYPPASLEELQIPEEVPAALQLLKKAGFLLMGATNQPDVAKGITRRDTVEQINAKLMATLPLEDIHVCFHQDDDRCACRKPLPGLLTQAAIQYDIALEHSFMIGDRWKDVEAGKLAGCRTVWLDYCYQEQFLAREPDFVTASLLDAARWIINGSF